jgi:hypothetical protein
MTKKQFKSKISVHVYGRQRDTKLIAVFYDWKEDHQNHVCGFKYCLFARATMSTQAELINIAYDFIVNQLYDTPYYIQTIVAMEDKQRFKVPIVASGLSNLIQYK